MTIVGYKSRKSIKSRTLLLILFWIFIAMVGFAKAEKVGDIASMSGVRENQLIGYGLIVGLNGSGDKSGSKFTMQSVSNMLESMNVKVSPNDIKSKNIAAVMVTASLPAFGRSGDKIDIKISSIGDAKSIIGGTLVMTPLTAVDGNIYAIAQGAILNGNSNNALSATVMEGATIEREVPYSLKNQQGDRKSVV